MRTFFVIVVAASLCGCASTKSAQTNGQTRGSKPGATPVVKEPPTISERVRYQRQVAAKDDVAGLTEVEGAVRR